MPSLSNGDRVRGTAANKIVADEVSGCIHPIKLDEPDMVQGAPQVTGYTLGARTVKPDAAECLAKRADDQATGTSRFWLKRATSGVNAGKLFNRHWPIQDERAGYKFVKATEDAFNSYLRFLETENPMFLRQAERA